MHQRNKRFTTKKTNKCQDLRVGNTQTPTLSTKPSLWRTKYSCGQPKLKCRQIAKRFVKSRRAKELVWRQSSKLFKTHELRNNSMWASKLSTIANPQNAHSRGGNATTSNCAIRNIPNSTVLPTTSLELLYVNINATALAEPKQSITSHAWKL